MCHLQKLNHGVIPPQPVNTIVIVVVVGWVIFIFYYSRQGDFWSAIDSFRMENEGPVAAAARLQYLFSAIRWTFVLIDFHHGHRASPHNVSQLNAL